jgi:hypothetical protein
MVGRQIAESIGFDFQRAIEASTEVLQRDRLRQLDYLFIAEQRLNLGEDFISHVGGRARHSFCVTQHGLFAAVEIRTALEGGKIFQLVVGDSRVSANGRVDIHSERAPDHLCCAHERDGFEASIDNSARRNSLVEPAGGQHYFRPMSRHESRRKNAAELLDALLESIPYAFRCFVWIDPFDSHRGSFGYSLKVRLKDSEGIQSVMSSRASGKR